MATARIAFYEEFQRVQNALKKRLFNFKKVDFEGSAEQLLELGKSLRQGAFGDLGEAHCSLKLLLLGHDRLFSVSRPLRHILDFGTFSS